MSESNPTSATDVGGDTSAANLIGTRLGDYQVLRRLGRGGMADVYVALHQSLDRQVALKVLRRKLANDTEYVERFRREARAAAKLSHPNIVQVYEVGREGDHHYIAQELVDGPNLRERVESHGPLSIEDAIAVLRAVTLALMAAHRMGIIHRDIKPENILQSRHGDIKVADFGLARLEGGCDLTQAGLTMGTPRYMSPEQVQGKAIDHRSDLYSLGCSLYFLLSGQPPFDADEPLAVALQHLNETAKPLPTVRGNTPFPAWLLTAINRMMAKNPADRFESAAELSRWIGDQSGLPIDAFAGGTAEATVRLQQVMLAETRQRRQARKRRLVGLLLPIIAAVVGTYAAIPRHPHTVPRLLRPDRVPAKETVQQQFLAAVSRDDIAGWKAVSEHFPAADNDTNASYAIKAELQLARLLVRLQRQPEAVTILERIADDPAVDRLFRAAALSQLIDLNPVDSPQTTELWDKLRRTYQTLIEVRPETQRSLPSIIGTEKFGKLESS